MKTYSELFKLSSRPEEVITMDDAIVYNQEETINNYIVTSEIEEKLSKVFHNLTLDKGKGFWVQGAYGSGKSHFMSFLTILLHENNFWDRLPEETKGEYQDIINNKNFLTVNFTLSEVEDLRVKIFDEIEKSLHKDGQQIFIKNDKKIVDQFLQGEYEGLQENWFLNILEEKCHVKRSEWKESLKKNDIRRLSEIIISYKQATNAFSQKEYKEIIYPDIKEGLQRIMDKVNDKYDGIVLFIDELSEFFQKMKSKGKESDALETIQALGQRIRKAPIWVFAAVQKNPAEIIDEELYISEEEEKVFDRFEPIVLSEADIEEIIDQRVIIKSENNRKIINYIYDELRESIPHLEKNITPERFVKLYPFHHEFVQSLIYLSNYGSRQRAAIRECWNIVNERLNTPGDRMITIDVLYDVFRDSIIHDYFKEYFDLYENIYEEIINKPGFDSDKEQARQVMKALIIYGIRDKQHVDSKEVARLIMADLGLGLGLNLIYEEIDEILMRIYEEAKGQGLNLQKSSASGEENKNLWKINPASSGVSVEPEIISEMRNLNDKDMAGLIPMIINSNHHLFVNLEVAWNSVRRIKQTFNWRNTEREGKVLLKSLDKINNLPEINPVQDELDFGLIIEFPLLGEYNEKVQTAKKLKDKDERYIYWIPKNFDNETKHTLKRLTAVKKIIDKYENPENDDEFRKKTQLESQLNTLSNLVDKRIENCYLDGIMVSNMISEENLQQFTDIKGLIEHFLNHILSDLYEKHPRYKFIVTRRQTNKLIRDFVIPRLSKEYTNELENVGEPLGIVERRRGKYELELKNELFTRINKILSDSEWHGLDGIYKEIRSEPWGLQKDSFEVIIAALIANGECRAKTKNDEIISSEKFTRSFIGNKELYNQFESISKGDLVNNNIWSDIKNILDLYELDYEGKKTMFNQERIWTILIAKSLGLKNKVNDAKNYLNILGADLGQFAEFTKKLTIFKDFKDFLTEIEKYKKDDSSTGLRVYRQTLLERFSKFDIFKDQYRNLKGLLLLAEERIDNQLKKEYKYFKQIEIENDQIKEIKKGFCKLSSIIDDQTKVRNFLKKTEKVKEEYQISYITSHQEYHNKYQNFLDNVRNMDEYKVLNLLNKLEKIYVSQPLNKRMELLKDNYYNTCLLQIDVGDLVDQPFCSCGYKIGEKFVPISSEKIKEDFRNSIKEYFSKLKSPNSMEHIAIYLDKNPESKLKELKDIEPYNLDKILDLVDEEFVLEVNKAYKVAYPIRISIEDVVKLFRGTIHSTEISSVTQKLKKQLEDKVKEEIKDKEGISFERVVILFEDIS